MTISPDEIVITAGALEALNLSLQAVTEPGDWVIVENPCFYGALQALERLRLKRCRCRRILMRDRFTGAGAGAEITR
jgi:DNA-binding transcriptional MocR family regulator